MKYEIDTIPVWDALKAGSECPLCLLERRSRQAAVKYYLGPSVMVPEVRVTVNDRGFSPANLRLLAKDPNKLGLALVSHTRLKALRGRQAAKTKALAAEAARAAAKNPLEGLVGGKALKDQIASWTAWLRAEDRSCLIEEKVDDDLARYAFTLVHLWLKDRDFRTAWASSPGVCLRHTPDLVDMAADQLPVPALGAFVTEFLDLTDRNLGRVEEDVLAFTQTFDSTHSRTPVGNPDGALDRALLKLAGAFPEYEDEGRGRQGPLMGRVRST